MNAPSMAAKVAALRMLIEYAASQDATAKQQEA